MTRLELYDRFNMNCVNTEDCSKCKCCDDETGDLILCALMFGYEQGRADAIDECIEALGNNIWDIAKLEQLKDQNSN